jgi:hypothetical protein
MPCPPVSLPVCAIGARRGSRLVASMTAHRLPCLLLCTLLAGLSATAFAAPFRLHSSTIDGGGGHSQGARFAVEGTLGQPDVAQLAGARFGLDGGFWQPAAIERADTIFSNGFED